MLSKQKTSALVAAVKIVIRFIGLSILFVKSQKDLVIIFLILNQQERKELGRQKQFV